MIKVLEPIDITDILNSYNSLESEIQWTDMGHKGKQAGLQYKENEDPWTSAVGRSKGNDLLCNIINPIFKNTVFEEIINKYNFKRTRVLWVGPYACYSIHHDETPRIHIPLITNPGCLFLFRYGIPEHMPTGFVYWADTRKDHTFINCSDQHRLHLVGTVDS
jgi:hypothetical protein